MCNFSFYVRLCSGTALASLAIGMPLAVTVQAQPSNLAYEYKDGSFTAEAEINPLAGRLLGRALKKEIPSAVNFSATELAGSFTVPETTANLEDGNITLDSSPVKALLEPYLQQAMGQVAQSYNLPEEIGIETLESVINYSFIGQGQINATNSSTAFTFEYDDGTNSLAIKGIDPEVLTLCQVQECQTQVDGDFDLKLDVKGFNETSDELGIQLPSNIKRALRRAQLFGFKEVAFADGQLTSVVQVLPNLAPPAPALSPAPAEPTPATASDSSSDLTAPAAEDIAAPGAFRSETSITAPVEAPALDLAPNPPAPAEPGPNQAQAPQPGQKRTAAFEKLPQLTHGNFVLTAERLTAPWSMVFAVQSP